MMLNKQQGFLTVATVVIIVIFGLLAIVIAHIVISRITATQEHTSSTRAFYIATAGLEAGKRALLSDTPETLVNRAQCYDSGASAALATTHTNIAVGQGVFTLTATNNAPVTTVQVPFPGTGITAGATSIRVASISNFADDGWALLDREMISYTGITTSPPTLTGVTRGVAGTTAAAHLNGTRVSQKQCAITSDAGIPDLTSPTANRELRQGRIQQPDAYVVGRNSLRMRWDGARWRTVSGQNGRHSGISMLSHGDGWAVGNGGRVMRWNGTNWVNFFPRPTGKHLYEVHCIAANDCWAVGRCRNGGGLFGTCNGSASQRDLFVHWNGTTWTETGPYQGANGVPDVHMRGVTCVSANDCWAVGDNRTFAKKTTPALTWTYDPADVAIGAAPAGYNTVPNQDFLSVYCLATNDCWAVGRQQGGRALIVRKHSTTGGIWARMTAANVSLPNQQLNDVFCNATDDCWTVGNNSGGEVIGHWDGSTWIRFGPYAAIPNVHLESVHCSNATNCWATGRRNGGDATLLHWNGTVAQGGSGTWVRINSNDPDLPNGHGEAVAVVAPVQQPDPLSTEEIIQQ